MNRLNRKVEYALMALKYLRDQEQQASRPVSAKEVADTLHSPFDATARVMQVMTHHSLLQAELGVNGGYRLIGNLHQVSLLDLVEMIDGPAALVKCVHGDTSCDLQATCNVALPLTQLNERFDKFFRSVPLESLMTSEARANSSAGQEVTNV